MASHFRRDIQGLRAVAVLTVIASHAGLPHLEGGYVGVDVFFVVSGFLISSLLFREVERTGRLSLTGFWARRARRILPAATVVIVGTLVASMLWLSLVDARQTVYDAGWATVFAANIHFAARGVDYFAQGEAPSPLQHYWSLSVEEQFYLAWPLLLLAAVLLVRRRRGRHSEPTGLPVGAIAALLAVGSLASFGWSVVHTANDPVAAYFSTLTRAWELGVGALTALLAARVARLLTPRALLLAGGGGLVAIALACLLYDAATPFPGYAAALPVLGTAAVLLAGAGDRAAAPTRALGVTPLRVVGDWSYSLYLWHWPILIIAASWHGPLGPLATTAAIVLTFVLSWATYRWVETPFRSGAPARRLAVPRALVLYPLSVAVAAVACLGAWGWTAWQSGELGHNPAISVARYGPPGAARKDPVVALVQASVVASRRGVAIPSNLTPDTLDLRESTADVGDCDYTKPARPLCPRGDPHGDKTVVVTGDSHARAWIPAFDEIAAQEGWTAYYLAKPQCNAAHATMGAIDTGDPATACSKFHDWVSQQVASMHPDLVVVASAPPVKGVYDDAGDLVESIDRMTPVLDRAYGDLFEDLGRNAGRVVLIRDVPKAERDPAVCLTDGHPDLGDCMFHPKERTRKIGDIAVAAAREHGVDVVDPWPWLCWQDDCPVVVGSTISYRDNDHLSVPYSRQLAAPLAEALGFDPRAWH